MTISNHSPHRWQIAVGMSFDHDELAEFVKEAITDNEDLKEPIGITNNWDFATPEELALITQDDKSWIELELLAFRIKEHTDSASDQHQSNLLINHYFYSDDSYESDLRSTEEQQYYLFESIRSLSPQNPLLAIHLKTKLRLYPRNDEHLDNNINKALLIFKYKDSSQD